MIEGGAREGSLDDGMIIWAFTRQHERDARVARIARWGRSGFEDVSVDEAHGHEDLFAIKP
jgi:hypothetical protein